MDKLYPGWTDQRKTLSAGMTWLLLGLCLELIWLLARLAFGNDKAAILSICGFIALAHSIAFVGTSLWLTKRNRSKP